MHFLFSYAQVTDGDFELILNGELDMSDIVKPEKPEEKKYVLLTVGFIRGDIRPPFPPIAILVPPLPQKYGLDFPIVSYPGVARLFECKKSDKNFDEISCVITISPAVRVCVCVCVCARVSYFQEDDITDQYQDDQRVDDAEEMLQPPLSTGVPHDCRRTVPCRRGDCEQLWKGLASG